LGGPESGLAALEGFIEIHPGSAWTASLRGNLAEHYRELGRLTPALEHFERAWESSKRSEERAGKEVADFTLAHWTRLLASLGRREQLLELLGEQARRGRPMRGALAQMLNRTSAGVSTMLHSPGISYRCGSLALYNLGRAVGGRDFDGRGLLEAPSPETGFSMSVLVQWARRLELDLRTRFPRRHER